MIKKNGNTLKEISCTAYIKKCEKSLLESNDTQVKFIGYVTDDEPRRTEIAHFINDHLEAKTITMIFKEKEQ